MSTQSKGKYEEPQESQHWSRCYSNYEYSPLPTSSFSFRLLRLSLVEDSMESYEVPVQCELLTYTEDDVQNLRVPRYEALSYVWGDPHATEPILVNDSVFKVTKNLYAALLQLRTRLDSMNLWTRHICDFGSPKAIFIWIDAICINQQDLRERGHQVRRMATIYTMARRVIVWLGEESNNTQTAIEGLSEFLDEYHGKEFFKEKSKRMKMVCTDIFDRRWFRRIWVLQEVAAADTVVVLCGSYRITGQDIARGIMRLHWGKHSASSIHLRVLPVISLFRDKPFLRELPNRALQGTYTLKVRPLGHLLDMYHIQEASDRRDKIYAILGMRSDFLESAVLEPDYNLRWSSLFAKVVRLLTHEAMDVVTSDDHEAAVLRTKVKFLGRIIFMCNRSEGSEGEALIQSINTSKYMGGSQTWSMKLIVHAPAKLLKKGDYLCVLPQSPKPIVVRRRGTRLYIILIDASHILPSSTDWPTIVEASILFPKELKLIWDWSDWSSSKPFTVEESTASARATKLKNMALLLEAMGDSRRARSMFGAAVRAFRREEQEKQEEKEGHKEQQEEEGQGEQQEQQDTDRSRTISGTTARLRGKTKITGRTLRRVLNLCALYELRNQADEATNLYQEFKDTRNDVEAHRMVRSASESGIRGHRNSLEG